MKTIVLGAIAIIILFFANLAWGSVNIPWQDVGAIISGSQSDETYRYILLESRLPAAITALLSGAALATSGLLLQTAFRNPRHTVRLTAWRSAVLQGAETQPGQ